MNKMTANDIYEIIDDLSHMIYIISALIGKLTNELPKLPQETDNVNRN